MVRLLILTGVLLGLCTAPVRADEYADTIELFKAAGASSGFFDDCYGYVVFPSVGKGGIGIGAARGKGRVFRGAEAVGRATMTQLSVGLQLGGQVFSQIIFLQDQRAFDEFTSGSFEFEASASAVAITAGASASAGSSGSSAGASGGKKDATTAGRYYKGMAVFTIAKGGLMYEASLAGQKFSYEAY